MTPPMTPHDLPEAAPSKNYVEPFSPTPPRSVPIHEYVSFRHTNMSYGLPTPGQSRSTSGTTSPIESTSPTNTSNIYQPPRRPQHLRTHTAGSITTLSSMTGSTQTGGIAPSVPVPTQYQVGGQRPLPPLHRPQSFSSSPRSIDLVTPFVPAAAPSTYEQLPLHSAASSEHALYYERRSTISGPSSPTSTLGGSLKTLFNFDAIRGRPYTAETPGKGGAYAGQPESPENYLYGDGSSHFSRTVTLR
ncbi:hypothetical protein EDC01DRAFT_669717 [Geopyxis carbonaria]|nr:hypothetical protein EDC01DRAFT_669717 [Geopyxis carbonaria]